MKNKPINLSKMTLNELLLEKYHVSNLIRHQRILNVFKNMVMVKATTQCGDIRYSKLNFLTESLSRELRFTIHRDVFIDDILDQIETLMGID